MIVDVHHHLVAEPGYLDALLRQMDRLDIARMGLIAMGPDFADLFRRHPGGDPVDEHDLLRVIRTHPDRFWAYVFIRPGSDGPEKIRYWGEQGFLGVKLHVPAARYDDEAYFPLYAEADSLGMTCLFHSGLFHFPHLRAQRLSAERTRPIYVETIAHAYPDLSIILAHMGVVWAEEACGLARMFPNIYLDMSGRLDGWRAGKSLDWFREMLFWPDAASKLLFGSDVHVEELPEAIAQQQRIVRGIGWRSEEERKFLFDNAATLFATTKTDCRTTHHY